MTVKVSLKVCEPAIISESKEMSEQDYGPQTTPSKTKMHCAT